MGTSTSRYEQTNWDEADGELKSQSETVDVSPPTANFTKLTIHPKVAIPFIGQQLPVVGQLVAAREYEVRDDQGDIVYTTKKAEKLEKGFDLLEPDGDGDVGRVILRVDSTFSNRTWHVFNVDKPCFEGQRPAPGPSEKASAKLYRKATVFFRKGEGALRISAHVQRGRRERGCGYDTSGGTLQCGNARQVALSDYDPGQDGRGNQDDASGGVLEVGRFDGTIGHGRQDGDGPRQGLG
mmetsp:Transcript_9988/g.29552  ORF Transcript_9988/g.29552 Transcript_9988/m.29552 type:complete len:238 (-) Transcript_9988:193-906(-)